MHHERLNHWQHDHVFGQDRKRPGEIRTLIVVGLTLAMMVWEILAGIICGSMALLADGLQMGYKERIQARCQSLVHVTVEPLRCD